MTRKPKKRPPSPSLSHRKSGLPDLRKIVRNSGKPEFRAGLRGARRASKKHDPLDAVIDATACSLGLKINQAWKPAIRAHLQVTLRHGSLVAAFALPDDAEPAPVFEP
jgi:hypothetical protein